MSKSMPRDKFVQTVKKKVGNDEPLIQVQGFVGDSTVSGYFRLYADASLNNSIDIPESDVVHFEKLSAESSPMGGYKIWLNKDAVFAVGDTGVKNRPQRKFLDGDLVAQAKTDLVGYTPISWYVTGCNSGWHTCQSHFWTDCQQSRFFTNCTFTGGTILTDRTITITRTSALDACPSALACPTDTFRIPDRVVNPAVGRRFNETNFGPFQP